MTISGLPCPTCGVTHALISILKLDFDAYMKYNPMAIPLVLAVVLAIYFKKFKHKRIIIAIILFIAIANLIIYLKRMI
ncbi:MAG: DUF2752 domain-containing protein [Clostridia bacterium]|nr:DUF2752 domain-containing protein [Clostridia bacterium]